MTIGTMPIKQGLRAFAQGDRPHPSDQDSMRVALDRIVQFAIQYRQGVGQGQRPRCQFAPVCIAVAFDALYPAPSCEIISDVFLIVSKHIDAETAMPLQYSP